MYTVAPCSLEIMRPRRILTAGWLMATASNSNRIVENRLDSNTSIGDNRKNIFSNLRNFTLYIYLSLSFFFFRRVEFLGFFQSLMMYKLAMEGKKKKEIVATFKANEKSLKRCNRTVAACYCGQMQLRASRSKVESITVVCSCSCFYSGPPPRAVLPPTLPLRLFNYPHAGD